MSPLQVLLPLLATSVLVSLLSTQFASASLASFVMSRPKLFQRAQVQPQANQQQPQQLQPQASQNHQQRFVFAANNMMPNYGHFGLSQQADLLRVGQAQASHLQPQSHNLERDLSQLNPIGFDTQPAGYYKPAIEPLVHFIPAQNEAAAAVAATSQARGLRLEPSQSEIVDKIERHIGQQIDQSLSSEAHEQNAAASGYLHEHSHQQQPEQKEKEASASHPEESEEVEEPLAEKRHHEEKKPAEEEHHHHEHPPMEAFEVHHKKGGKSFQYFHQGHHE